LEWELWSKSTFDICIEVALFKDGDYYIAYSPALDLSAYGNSEEDAKIDFEEQLDIFIKETSEKGTLEKVLLEQGWKLKLKPRPAYVPPRRKSSKLYKGLTPLGKIETCVPIMA